MELEKKHPQDRDDWDSLSEREQDELLTDFYGFEDPRDKEGWDTLGKQEQDRLMQEYFQAAKGYQEKENLKNQMTEEESKAVEELNRWRNNKLIEIIGNLGVIYDALMHKNRLCCINNRRGGKSQELFS